MRQLRFLSATPAPLSWKLRALRGAARAAPTTSGLEQWSADRLPVEPGERRRWVQRAWWGLTAGEVLRAHLYDRGRRARALELLDPPDWREVDEARRRGGVIFATGHVGPPKFAMNALIEREDSLLVWTNTRDAPSWLAETPGLSLLDPLDPSLRSTLMLKTALHLRSGGALFGAPDWPTGARRVSIEEWGQTWEFSCGVPALARALGVPVFLLLALWRGNRIFIHLERLATPVGNLTDDEWHRRWLEGYWDRIKRVIEASPENLRFLRSANNGSLRRELGL